MTEKLQTLFEKYNFDYIYINKKDIEKLDFEMIPEEYLMDYKTPKFYIGTVKLNDSNVEVYWDKKITPGDVIFKYKDIKKERNIKLKNIS